MRDRLLELPSVALILALSASCDGSNHTSDSWRLITDDRLGTHSALLRRCPDTAFIRAGRCPAGFVGRTCTLQCPLSAAGVICSGCLRLTHFGFAKAGDARARCSALQQLP